MVKVDISDVEAGNDAAVAALRRVPTILASEVRKGAVIAKAEHAYSNRTGNLEKSTGAVVERSSMAEARVVLQANTDYAVFVQHRGLMSIDLAASVVESGLDLAFERLKE